MQFQHSNITNDKIITAMPVGEYLRSLIFILTAHENYFCIDENVSGEQR
jgi:hypothetical protein